MDDISENKCFASIAIVENVWDIKYKPYIGKQVTWWTDWFVFNNGERFSIYNNPFKISSIIVYINKK